jgi:hypothetical protein
LATPSDLEVADTATPAGSLTKDGASWSTAITLLEVLLQIVAA